LPYDATEDDIRVNFQICGNILEFGIRIARNYNSRQSKGLAYEEYKNPEGARGAVQKAAKPFGMSVKGRPSFVDYEEGTMKGSFKTTEGRLWGLVNMEHKTSIRVTTSD
jgi:RNA recognition motif-containing protein